MKYNLQYFYRKVFNVKDQCQGSELDLRAQGERFLFHRNNVTLFFEIILNNLLPFSMLSRGRLFEMLRTVR